ncbi:713_t:CDS:1, partial [Funneliformis mosseae]
DGAAFSFESFSESFLKPLKRNVIPQKDFQQLLAEFYCNIYNKEFVALLHIHNTLKDSIPVLPNIDQFDRLRIRTEIFGSTLSSRHTSSAKILARFILSDDTFDTYPGQIQFFFEHMVYLPEARTHHLAYVRWYKPAENPKIRFHCQVADDDKTCNIEL